MYVFFRFLLGAIVALTVCFDADSSFAQGKPQLPWAQGRTLEYNAVNQDLKLLLRSIIRADGGFNIIIKPEVKGEVTVQFRKVPVAAAFNQVIEENNLDYTYAVREKTVTVFPRSGGRSLIRAFVTPAVAKFGAIQRALRTHGLGTDGLAFDASSNTVSIFGELGRVKDISDLIKQLDAAELQRLKLRQDKASKKEEQATQSRLAYAARVKADADKGKADAERRKAEFQQKLYARMLDFKVKVIRLRFASVSATDKKFQNKSFTVPGIEDTLQKILGLVPPGQQQSGNASAANTLARQTGLYFSGMASGGGSGGGAENPAYEAALMAGALKPVISVDQRTNSVIVRGTDQAIAGVEKIIKQLDQPLRMIEVEVAIVKADSNVTEELGVAWRARLQRNGRESSAIDSGTSGGQSDDTTSGLNALSLLPAQTAGRTVASFFVVGGAAFLQAQVSAFAEKNRAQTIASPRVVTLDNVTARVTAATNLFVQTVASGDSGATIQQIEAGLELDILPSIVPSDVAGEQNLVRLVLTARNSTPSIPAAGAVAVSVDSREVQTQVLIPDGATFVMGGLFADTRNENRLGIPFLQDIPFLGALFRTAISANSLNETIFMITPRIVDGQELAEDIAIRAGTRDYMKRQRDILRGASREIEKAKSLSFPNAVRTQEEQE
jgi:type II secretory pathway component GspD/PulD (secretin)